MLRLGKQLDAFAQLLLEVVGKFRGVSAKYQIIISMRLTCLLKTRKYFVRENVAQVAFRSIISTGIVCNEYLILFR